MLQIHILPDMLRSWFAIAAILQSFGLLTSAQDVANTTNTSSDCPEQGGVHVIVSRASLEPLGYGIIGAVKDSVLAQIPGSTAEFTVWEATLDQYITSESDGVFAARALINAYINNCPGQPLVVMGYSQGAQVSADSLIGQDVKNFPPNATIQDPLPDSTLSAVAAVILMGDPTFITNETFRVGNATKDSVFPRRNADNFDATDLSSRTQSYCNDGDPYCASGGSLIVHLKYVAEFGVDAASFVVQNVASWYSANGNNSTAVTPKPSASARVSAATASLSRAVASASASASVLASASASLSGSPVSSATATTSTGATMTAASPSSSLPVSSGAASSLEVAGAGVLAVGLFAFML